MHMIEQARSQFIENMYWLIDAQHIWNGFLHQGWYRSSSTSSWHPAGYCLFCRNQVFRKVSEFEIHSLLAHCSSKEHIKVFESSILQGTLAHRINSDDATWYIDESKDDGRRLVADVRSSHVHLENGCDGVWFPWIWSLATGNRC